MLNAKNRKKYSEDQTDGNFLRADSFGQLSMETLDIRLFFSSAELDDIIRYQELALKEPNERNISDQEFSELQELYVRFIQTHNHELAHFYQILALPTFQLFWCSSVNWFKIEMLTLLTAMDHGKSVTPSSKLVLFDLTADLPVRYVNDVDDLYEAFDFYKTLYYQTSEGLSVQQLVEGMAHAISLQLSDHPETDPLNLFSAPLYGGAYKYFVKHCSEAQLDNRWKLMLFIYFCYFSLHSKPIRNDASTNPLEIFRNLCNRLMAYISAFEKLAEIYSKLDRADLNQRLEHIFDYDDLKFATPLQMANMLAFSELIEQVQSEVRKWGISFEPIKLDDAEFLEVPVQKIGENITDVYFLIKTLAIPKNFVLVREIYDELFGDDASEYPLSFSSKSQFYEFMRHFRNATKGLRVSCCEKHGIVDFDKKVLKCKEEGGFAYYCESMFGRPATEIFKW